MTNYGLYETACSNGDLNTVKTLLPKLPYFAKKNGFAVACYNEQLEIAKWLYCDQPRPDLSQSNQSLYVTCCLNGHLKTAKWLGSILHLEISYLLRRIESSLYPVQLNDYHWLLRHLPPIYHIWVYYCYYEHANSLLYGGVFDHPNSDYLKQYVEMEYAQHPF
jgi:hypothetical protein